MKFLELFVIVVAFCVGIAWLIGTADCAAGKIPVRGIVGFECVSR